MSDNFYKTIGVQNNIILRGQPLIGSNAKLNPLFLVEGSSCDVELKNALEKTNKVVESLATQLKSLTKEIEQLKKSPAPATPPVTNNNKPSAKPVTKI